MKRRRNGASLLLLVPLLLVSGAVAAPSGIGIDQAIPYDRGQNVAPIYEGWQRRADGTTMMFFGYLTRNYQETVDIPVGPNNSFDPGPIDRGQPTHFLVRRQAFVVTVVLPKNWDEKA